MTSQERLHAYQLIVDGCSHIWSKNKLQEDRAQKVLNDLIPLTKNDPYFLAHLTSWAMKNSDAKDLRVFLTYVSCLSDADGSPFAPGSKYRKPSLRLIGWSALHMLEPKLADRVLQLANRKFEVPGFLNNTYHFPQALRVSLQKYLKYREQNIGMVEGIKKSGLGNVLKRMYQRGRIHPSAEVAQILRWKQKDGSVSIAAVAPKFEGLSDLEIAEKIRAEKIPYIGVLGELSKIKKKVSPVLAVAMLEQATGNQAVIMRATFEDAGVLKDPEVMALFTSKIAEAKTALDRAKTLSENASAEVKEALVQARSTKRKDELSGVGKIFLHLDTSSSMQNSVELAKKYGAIIAEMVPNPETSFKWATFDDRGRELELPQEFVEPAFAQVLYKVRCNGMTDAMANYETARRFGADVDVFISDGGHNGGDIRTRIENFHRANPSIPKPKACVWIPSGTANQNDEVIIRGYVAAGIPCATIRPQALTESALVAQAVRAAMTGPVSLVDDIMDAELLKLPEYYYVIS